MKHNRYNKEHVIHEAKLFLDGATLREISECTKTPISTVSWHLINTLYDCDIQMYIDIRIKLMPRCKNKKREMRETKIIEKYHHTV